MTAIALTTGSVTWTPKRKKSEVCGCNKKELDLGVVQPINGRQLALKFSISIGFLLRADLEVCILFVTMGSHPVLRLGRNQYSSRMIGESF